MSKIFIKTFGCTLNKKDSKNIVANYNYSEDEKDTFTADYIIINTCGVKERTDTKIINYLKKLKQLNISEKKIIICGCLVTIDKELLTDIFPNANYFKIEETKQLQKLLGSLKLETKTKKVNISEPIILSNGCLGNCNYCAVKFARGKLKSKSEKDIILEIEKTIENGSKEILLTSQDNGCYGFDINTNIVKLLSEIIKIKGNFLIRLGMANPQHLKIFKKELIEIYKHEKLYKFLHIPIQSGDNQVLKDMNRFYNIEDVFDIIKEFRKEIPEITIATDIIVGYPTESEEEFQNTIEVIKKLKPDVVNISRFGQRKRIEANKHKDLLGAIKKKRSRELTILCRKISLNNNKLFLNTEKEVLVTEVGKNNTVMARTVEYKPVGIKGNYPIGTKLKVKIINYKANFLIGKNSLEKM
ncbi:tRNA (N(6)-L-threonylcarbamoyladenosine(37)-C(2))-methylthiotransferase [archaeon]|nr:tRNA (N(6)-L-threonylcarbamoyladenosine(37)-C(2))-methylthiotransferase [archaeon]